jgi:geranylgeranyl diphosphate synthase, type II
MHSLTQLLDLTVRYGREMSFPDSPVELYAPCEYILQLGGKRLRPALLLMGYEMFADHPANALPAAWAVELFHNFTLMHDDIMDAAPLRRGQPTVHTRWNLTTGILSGDVMLIHAYRHLCSLERTDRIPDLIQIFNRTAIEVCEGQQMDVNFETRQDVSIPEYLRMIELKTAVLLAGALEMGARYAGAPPTEAGKLYAFGRLAGIAFQLQDDLLDTYGDPEKFGKQVGGDILQNKKTYLVLKAMENAPESDRAELRHWMSSTDFPPVEKVEAVRAIFNRNAVPEAVEKIKQSYQEEAFASLDAVQVAPERKQILREAVEALFVREL